VAKDGYQKQAGGLLRKNIDTFIIALTLTSLINNIFRVSSLLLVKNYLVLFKIQDLYESVEKTSYIL
jgi:hypothetical protein